MMTKQRFDEIKKMDEAIRVNLLKLCPTLTDDPGIYVWFRTDENGIGFCYVGKSKAVLTRQVQHVHGHESTIDMGLDQYHLYDSVDNPYGYRVCMIPCALEDLNKMEQKYILHCARRGWQVLNRTTGGDKGKRLWGDKVPAVSSYRQGVADGRKAMAREVAELLEDWIFMRYKGPLMRRLRELLSEAEDNISAV